ncbi:MAG TPA: carboxypeptidase-like regulatory domain-containing protein, partial [Pyrinomonadaceae bacterium]|nr:carboxypeptidase-like regulatory domain-containing protein [Pyrinomonadaceae bacterium]
ALALCATLTAPGAAAPAAAAGAAARAQSAAQQPAPQHGTASVSGRVTDGERGLAGLTVLLFSFDRGERGRFPVRTRTDAEGRYRFDGLRAGRYRILPHAPAHVTSQDVESWPPGAKIVSVLAGDTAEDVDFRLKKGGVITGRVTGADGQPVVGEPVNVLPTERGPQQERQVGGQRQVMTDDRGVYRAYGLAPGRYRVSVGAGVGANGPSPGLRRFYRLTFHPGATDEAEAAVVEVAAGAEVDEVDISVGRPVKTFRAAGRVVSAETGQPVVGVRVGVGSVDPSGRRLTGYAGGQPTNARGEFTVEGIRPGRYAASLVGSQEGGEWYAEPVVFAVGPADATGIELKVKRGGSVAGVVQVEGLSDRGATARLLSQVRVFALYEQDGGLSAMGPPAMGPPPSAPADGGTFYIGGLRPGRVRINADSRAAGLTVARVELGGADVRRAGIPLGDGAQVSGVRVVLVYGTAVLRGRVGLEGDVLPPNTRLFVSARRVGTESGFERQAVTDSRGRFQFDGLPAGTYEVRARGIGPDPRTQRYEGRPQQVFVADGAEQQITLVIEPAAPASRPPGAGVTP